jgi:hypothetical protein
MKKLFLIFLAIIFAFIFMTAASAASVIPDEYPGNDANTYTPPEGCIRTTLPDSDKTGTHVYTFNDFGQLDPGGTNTLTIEVGKATGTNYTQVLSWTWSGSYPLYSIIVKGGPAYNEYVYDGTATTDTNLVSPVNASGDPADISHVSVVLCPEKLPPVPPDGGTICCIIIIVLLIMIVCLLAVILVNILEIKCIICYRNCHECDEDHID